MFHSGSYGGSMHSQQGWHKAKIPGLGQVQGQRAPRLSHYDVGKTETVWESAYSKMERDNIWGFAYFTFTPSAQLTSGHLGFL